MTGLEDDVYSFGFILLEALLGSMASESDASFLSEMVFPNLCFNANYRFR